MISDKIQISKYPSILSDIKWIFYESLSYKNDLVIIVSDSENNFYEIIFEHPILFQVTDETYLTHYWFIKEKGIGSTCIINNSDWADKFILLRDHFPNIQHYLIGTQDDCVEVLTDVEPIIRKK